MLWAAQSFVFGHQKNEPTGSRSRPAKPQHDMHNENIPGSEPFPNEPTHNMPLRQLSGWGLTLETGLARELGNLLAAAFRSAPPKADTDQDGMSLLHRRHRPQMPQSSPSRWGNETPRQGNAAPASAGSSMCKQIESLYSFDDYTHRGIREARCARL